MMAQRQRMLERRKMVAEALRDPDRWRPNYSDLCRALKLPIATVHDTVARLRREGRISIEVTVRSVGKVPGPSARGSRRWMYAKRQSRTRDR